MIASGTLHPNSRPNNRTTNLKLSGHVDKKLIEPTERAMRQQSHHSFNAPNSCDIIDKINELDKHMNSISALIYIASTANFAELDTGIFQGFLNSISIINNSYSDLLKQLRGHYHEM